MLAPLVAPMHKARQETVSMGSINYSDHYRDGDFSDAVGVSARRWPYLSTRLDRREDVPPGDSTAIFAWDGHSVRVEGGALLYDERPIDNVRPGEKQFAVVNTKLVIWPDRKYIDIKNGKFVDMEPSFAVKGATITANSITADPAPIVSREAVVLAMGRSYTSPTQPGTYVYGSNPSSINFNYDTGTWSLPPYQRTYLYNVKPGDIMIPTKSGGYYRVDGYFEDYERIDTSKFNRDGCYAVCTRVQYNERENDESWHVYADIYRVGKQKALFSTFFKVGMNVAVKGTPGAYNDIRNAVVAAIDDDTNKITLNTTAPGSAFRLPEVLGEIKAAGDGKYSLKKSDSVYYNVDFQTPAAVGTWLVRNGSDVELWDPVQRITLATAKATQASAPVGTVVEGQTFTNGEVDCTVYRQLPDMDFICSRNNRLWGVSSRDKSVYCSALGDPENFWEYGVLANAPWAAVIGSDGDFTGIASYRQYLLCFKGEEIIKVMGDTPASFGVTSTKAEGIKAGCHKSAVVLDGILFYMGSYGVYAYTGNTPQLISPGYGPLEFGQGVAGSDGDSYFISCVDQKGDPHLLVYETREHLWVQEDKVQALDFARKDRDLYMLLKDGSVQQIGAGPTDRWMPWSVTYKPLYVTSTGRKKYLKIRLRVEMPAGSWVEISTRADGGAWEQAGRILGETATVVPIRLRPGRCDKMEIRLDGQGECTIKEVAKEYRIGSDK